MSDLQKIQERQMADSRKEAGARRVLHELRRTIRLRGITPDTDTNAVLADLTDESLAVIAPLVEAWAVMEQIIWASDGCVGHKLCAHSMEPWQKARQLLYAEDDKRCAEIRRD